MRYVFIIVVSVVVLLILGAGAYFFFFAHTPGVTVTNPSPTTLPTTGSTTVTITPGSTETTPTTTRVTDRLVKISAGPVVPGEVITRTKAPDASSSPETAVTYIERQSGNVYSYLVGAGRLIRISNRTLPGILQAAWLPNGHTAIVEYLSDDVTSVNTYGLPSDGTDGFFLPMNLAGVAVSNTGILSLASGVNGSVASVYRSDGTHGTTAFETPLSMVNASFLGKSQYLVYTKPSAAIPGSAYVVSGGGQFTRIEGPLMGLVALAGTTGKWVFVSYTDRLGLHSELIDTQSHTKIPIPIATIATKCVFTADDSAIYCGVPTATPSAQYPDDWYQGALHLSDRLWKIDVKSRFVQLVLDFSTVQDLVVDVETPAVDTDNTTLTFVNKNDGSLWSYSL